MSTPQVENYRNAAAGERSSAEAAKLPHVRDRHLRSAEAWDAMADQADHIAQLAEVNAEEKNKHPYARKETHRSASDLAGMASTNG